MWCENYRWNYDYARLAYDAGFSFEGHKLQSNLDFAKIALIDIETLIRDKDVITIERFIPFITQFALEGEQVKILDPCFVKVFRISQLAVEYLLFCKKYLDNTVILLKKELATNSEESKELKTTNQDLKSEVNHLRRKLKDLECTPAPEIATFRCEHCGKVFATDDYLQAHIRRRHELSNNNSAYQEETNKLQLEIKELKERLNTTEKLLTHREQNNEKDVDTTKEGNWSKLEELQQKFDVLKMHVESELKLLRTQKEYQEKYENLFEATINKTKAAFLEAESLQAKLANRGQSDLVLRKNSATQTFLQVQEVAIEASCEDFEQKTKVKAKSEEQPDLKVDLEKMQKELVAETQQQINKVEDALGEMVASSLGKIESQVQTALQKLSAQAVKTQDEVEDSPQKSFIPIRATSAKQSPLKFVESAMDVQEHLRNLLSPTVPSQQDKKIIQRSKRSKNEKYEVPSADFVSSLIRKDTVAERKSKKKIEKSGELSADFVSSLRGKEIVAERKSKETIQLYASKKIMPPEIETESESEFEEVNVVETKPSTTSTLGQYSSSRIEKAASSEEVFHKLREEVGLLVERRLKEIGVSPDWKGLPQRSFTQALAVINHQAELSKKKFPDFAKIRKKLIRQLARMTKTKNESTIQKDTSKFALATNTNKKYYSDSESDDDRKKPQPPINKATYDSVISEFRNRTQTVKEIDSSSLDTLPEFQNRGDVAVIKSALKNELQVVEKKKVAFVDGDGDQNLKVTGSTTSIASSVFDIPKLNGEEKKKEKVDSDLSDWDISEILE